MRALGCGRPLGYIQCLLSPWLELHLIFPHPFSFPLVTPPLHLQLCQHRDLPFPGTPWSVQKGCRLICLSFYYCWFLFVLDNCSMAQADLKLTNSPGHARASLLFVHGPTYLEGPGLCEPGGVMIRTFPLHPRKLALQPRLTSGLQPPASASSCWDGKVHLAEAFIFLLFISALKGLLILI